MRTRPTKATLALLAALTPTLAHAQPAPDNPDWPCAQRLIPTLSAGSYWTAGPIATGDYSWRDDQTLTDLITKTLDRNTPEQEAATALSSYVAKQPADQRKPTAAKLFGYLVDETNNQRSEVIDRIESLARRQRNLDTLISSVSKQAESIPATATGEDATRRADLAGQRDFNIQTFQEAQRTIRYACEVPGTYERRLGTFAGALGGK